MRRKDIGLPQAADQMKGGSQPSRSYAGLIIAGLPSALHG
jgi:hypothetical protein